MTHTQGPWRVERVSHADDRNGNGYPHFHIVAGGYVLAALHRDNPTAAEDAALMAAAADMRRALEALLAATDPKDGSGVVDWDARAKAEAALAAAEGRRP